MFIATCAVVGIALATIVAPIEIAARTLRLNIFPPAGNTLLFRFAAGITAHYCSIGSVSVTHVHAPIRQQLRVRVIHRQQIVAGRAIIGDADGRLGVMTPIVTTEATRVIVMAQVIWMCSPRDLHERKNVLTANQKIALDNRQAVASLQAINGRFQQSRLAGSWRGHQIDNQQSLRFKQRGSPRRLDMALGSPITDEEVVREFRDFCVARSKTCRRIYERKFFYLFTCEYCFSHYVTAAFLILTRFQLLYPGWRGLPDCGILPGMAGKLLYGS
jgi:hypothetical protein